LPCPNGPARCVAATGEVQTGLLFALFVCRHNVLQMTLRQSCRGAPPIKFPPHADRLR